MCGLPLSGTPSLRLGYGSLLVLPVDDVGGYHIGAQLRVSPDCSAARRADSHWTVKVFVCSDRDRTATGTLVDRRNWLLFFS